MLLAARGGNGARKTGKLPWITISRGFAKEKKTKDVEVSADDEAKSNRETKALLEICDSPRRKMPEFSDELKKKHFEIGRRFNVEMTRHHNHESWQAQLKIDLKNLALKALPAEQLKYAMNVEMSDCEFPLDFRHPTYTPPIKGFRAELYASED